jgi:small-conductance mechanosensitive channel
VLHRVMRVLLAILLFAGIHELWDFNLFDEAGARIRHVVVSASFDLTAAILLAVLGWQLIKTGIDRNLAARVVDGVTVEPSMRARTLLPLARKFLVVVLVVMTAMLILSAIGVNIGPLLAGAGVIGLAIGFGAQTLVRDIITGVFLLLDDAFRVGEYIVSGNYKGTVEEIGIRAVKLRHHRGPLYTVPFSELRGVQNQSRDWVIDKFSIGITYDSDIEKARKLIKKIGEKLAADPEHAPHIMEPMKMQGVDSFGDFAMQVRVKMKTAGRAVRDPAQGQRADQEGLRRERHQVRLAHRHGLGRRCGGRVERGRRRGGAVDQARANGIEILVVRTWALPYLYAGKLWGRDSARPQDNTLWCPELDRW